MSLYFSGVSCYYLLCECTINKKNLTKEICNMPKFFVPYPITEFENEISISGEDFKHIRDVLRMKIGESITICDSTGMDHNCLIEAFETDLVRITIFSRYKSENESPFEIVIYQGLPKSDKMETIIQKCVELGGASIVPVACSRCIVKITDKNDIEKKLSRWNKIALEAAKQCNRSIIPLIREPLSFKEAAKQIANAKISFIPWECEEEMSIKSILCKAKDIGAENKPVIAFMIGPEGGFDHEEIEFAKKLGISSITLGKRILRTETVAPAILAMILYEIEL